MKRNLTIYPLLILCSLAITGCVMVSDGLVNVTDENINVKIVLTTGKVLEFRVPPHQQVAERVRFDTPAPRYKSIQAFDDAGLKIGEFSVDQLPNNYTRRYGKFITIMLTKTGLYPVPKKYFYNPEEHIQEIMEAGR